VCEEAHDFWKSITREQLEWLTTGVLVGELTTWKYASTFYKNSKKKELLLDTHWLCGERMSSDLFTKNLARPLFEKHMHVYIGDDEYMCKTHDG
jgi:hypothetical protein